MSIGLMIDCGVMSLSTLYSTWIRRRRLVSSIARFMLSVITSAYRIALPVHVPRRAADGLDQRAGRTQEAFLVRIQNRDQRHLRQVQTFAQQVDADQHVELAAPQVAQDLDAVERRYLRVQVAQCTPTSE